MKTGERGFTLIEILISLVVFAIVAIGALAALGATTTSGFLGAFPTSFATVRTARDYTAAANYLQSLQDYIASQGSSAATVGTYCAEPGGGCSSGIPIPSDYPDPDDLSTQMNWTKLDVVIQRWYWDNAAIKYCLVGSTGCGAAALGDYAVYVQSTLTWTFDNVGRTLTVNRFIPCTPDPDDCG